MSKALIEQLAKEHGYETWSMGELCYGFTPEQLKAFARAYQAASPIDNNTKEK
jgi:hypothetical protein